MATFAISRRTPLYSDPNKPGMAQVGAIYKDQLESKTTFSTTGDNKSFQKTKNWGKN